MVTTYFDGLVVFFGASRSIAANHVRQYKDEHKAMAKAGGGATNSGLFTTWPLVNLLH